MTSPFIEAGGLLILPRLQVQNANAVSGPLTWGFPAPTAFTGFAHALDRRLSSCSADACYVPPYPSLFVPSYSRVRQEQSPTL